MDKELTWAMIPASAGSKGLPDKSIRKFLGHPLIAHCVFFILNLTSIDKVLVTTYSKTYAALYGT